MTELTQTDASKSKSQPAIEHPGLEGTVASESSICFIDGPRSRLIYRGYSINDLAGKTTFEEIAYLLIFKKLPNKTELKDFTERLASERACPDAFLERMTTIPKTAHPMSVLRTLVSALAFFDPEAEDVSLDSSTRKAVRVTAQIPTIVATLHRLRSGLKPVAPDAVLNHAQNFLYMLTGKKPDPLFAEALDLYLVLLGDHELNASTFACRVTASTLSDYYSAITTAIGALKGPLHGGANEQVIKMLLTIGDPAKVEPFLQKAFADKKKIMGFGHRVYKVEDPRSPLLKEMAKKVCEKTGNQKLFQMSEIIERIVTAEKKLPSNVDFYSASLLYCIGIPENLFTPMFVLSRITGYSAHYLEQISDNRLLRPRAQYTGPMDLAYVPLEKR